MRVPGLPHAVVFDFDGLILDTESVEYTTIAAQFSRHGLRYELEAFARVVGSAWPTGWLDELADRAVAPVDHDDVLAARRAHRDELLATLEPLPGVVGLLDALADAAVAVAVASSSPRSWVEPLLERTGLRRRFAVVCTRDDVERAKPAPDLYALAVGRLGASPERSVALEDSHNGCTAAKAAGLRCVAVPNAITAHQDFTHADLVVGSLAQVDLGALRHLVAAP